jgi:DNA-binding response OmpR family regulator
MVQPLDLQYLFKPRRIRYNKDTMSPDISSSSVTPVSQVLIIDDNEDITELIKDFLETEDIECKIINRGIDGLEEIRKNDGYYNVVLLDLAMPEFSGLDVFNKLKEENLLNSNNVIIFTASSTQNSEINEMMNGGAKYILRKPSSIDEILDVVTRFTIKKDEI